MSAERDLKTSDLAELPARHDIEAGRGEPATAHAEHAALFDDGDATGFRTRWSAVQTGFVDEPRKAVEQADTLVAEVMQQLARMFADERKRLENEWEKNDQVSTEDLRQAMRRYRSFFERLLSV